jgi:hypothetical protein
MIPEPPADPAPTALLWANTIGGQLGRCTMCHQGTVTWLDLIGCELAPVVDDTGTLTDHAPLHRRCIPTLLTYWASLGHHGGPGELTGNPAGDDSDIAHPDDADDRDTPVDVPIGPAVPAPLPVPVAPPPVGIYA